MAWGLGSNGRFSPGLWMDLLALSQRGESSAQVSDCDPNLVVIEAGHLKDNLAGWVDEYKLWQSPPGQLAVYFAIIMVIGPTSSPVCREVRSCDFCRLVLINCDDRNPLRLGL